MLRIGIFGGTFSPPHMGHIYIAREAMQKAGLNKMIFIPCGNPYHKPKTAPVDAKHRFDMVRLAIENEPDFEISDIEVRSAKPSYTAETLEILDRLYPADRLCFLVGGDSLIDMKGWYKPEEIFKRAEVIVANRGGVDSVRIDAAVEEYRQLYGACITVIDINPVEISATDIRARLKAGAELSGIVPEKVLEYIRENELYKESIE